MKITYRRLLKLVANGCPPEMIKIGSVTYIWDGREYVLKINDKQTLGDAIRNWTVMAQATAKFITVVESTSTTMQCKDCAHHHYDKDNIPYCDRQDYGYGWRDEDYCSRWERQEE